MAMTAPPFGILEKRPRRMRFVNGARLERRPAITDAPSRSDRG